MPSPLKLMFIGAHPDDAEFNAGGLMISWVSAGHEVSILCLTNGAAGHYAMTPDQLALRRRQEARASADLLNADIEIWDNPDGELEPSISLRKALIKTIRTIKPDLIVTHRPADYHPDHRATAQLVQDATYLLQVPNIVPEVDPLRSIPPVLLCSDQFSYPRPIRPDLIIDTTGAISGVVELLHCHHSQVYEWLPHTQGKKVPSENRRMWLKQWYSARPQMVAKRYAQNSTEFAEVFEFSEYGGKFDPQAFEFLQPINKTD